MDQKYSAIVLIGMPGSGKGTQGRVIGRIPGFYFFSSGDMFRALDPKTEIGSRVHQKINRGELVSDELVMSLWREHLDAEVASGRLNPQRDTLILDGLPRTVPQTEMLDQYADVRCVLYLGCDDEERLIARLLRRANEQNRTDDQSDVIRRRLEIFHQQTAPLLDHYPPELVVEINALQTPLEVLGEIVQALILVQKAHAHRTKP